MNLYQLYKLCWGKLTLQKKLTGNASSFYHHELKFEHLLGFIGNWWQICVIN